MRAADRAPNPGRPSQRRPWAEIAALLLLVAVSVAVAIRWHMAQRRAPEDTPAFEVIRPSTIVPAPRFELLDLGARPVRLVELRGRVLLLNFWATWCPPCRDELPALEELARVFADEGLTVLAINLREPVDTVTKYVQEVGLRLRVLLDPDGDVGDPYGVLAIPTTVAVDRSGRIVGKIVGYREWLGAPAQDYVRTLLHDTGRGAS